MTEFTVKFGNVLEEPSDLLLLRYGQGFYGGADRAVVSRLISARVCTEGELQPRPGESAVVETAGATAPRRVLFLGTPPLFSFTYDEMEVFARRAVEQIAVLGLPVQVLTTTVPGTKFGLDGGEVLQRLVRGFRDGLSQHKLGAIERITFLTLGKRAERMLGMALAAIENSARTIPNTAATARPRPLEGVEGAYERIEGLVEREPEPPPTSAGPQPAAISLPALPGAAAAGKKRVFVAMPFSEEFENVYEFGIYPAVRDCGFICERVDQTPFSGDVVTRIQGGIEAADLVIADLTEARPNVYLEVGYAWGKGIPVIFVAKKGEKLHFDVSGHRCVYYGNFKRFEVDLKELLRGLEGSR